MNIENQNSSRQACFGFGIKLFTTVAICLISASAGGQSPTEFLYSGKLSQGEKQLSEKLVANPDDETRFGLGIIQFGLSIEHLVQSLNEHGFLTERTFGETIQPELRALFPDHSDPQTFSNDAFRKIVETWVADINRAEQMLSKITDDDVQFQLQPAKIQLVPAAGGKPVSAARLLAVMFPADVPDGVDDFTLTLDRGDVHWLRGYLHLQAALGEFILAHDFRGMIEVGAHRIFEKVETPHNWLLDEDRKITFDFFDEQFMTSILDAVALFSRSLEIPVVEPERFKAVLTHLEATVKNGQLMWEFIQAETDDDHEWIPNPRQKGSIDVSVSQEMIDTWLDTLKEADRILKGKTLVPFWRDVMARKGRATRGINIRKVFEHPPKKMMIILWIQGTEATPYLDEGEMTEFADEKFLERINRVFGSSFFGFAVWFN